MQGSLRRLFLRGRRTARGCAEGSACVWDTRRRCESSSAVLRSAHIEPDWISDWCALQDSNLRRITISSSSRATNRGDRVLTTPEVIGRPLCPNAGRAGLSKGNEGDGRSEQKLHGRTKSDLTRAGDRWNLTGANKEDSLLLLESQPGRMWFISSGHKCLGVLCAQDPCAPAQGKEALQSKPGTCSMAALSDLPSLDGRSGADLPDTFVQNRCRSAHEMVSRRLTIAFEIGAPCRIRTCDLQLRRLSLYPAELRARTGQRGGLYGAQRRGATCDFMRGYAASVRLMCRRRFRATRSGREESRSQSYVRRQRWPPISSRTFG